MDTVYHYPPELLHLLIDTIPLLCRTKPLTISFFRGSGVSEDILHDLSLKVNTTPKDINKYKIVRTILERLNEQGERTLRERREILKRVTEFDSFSSCWPDDQLKARGLVAEVRKVVNVKDSFMRMNQERKKEQDKHKKQREAKQRAIIEQKTKLQNLNKELGALFGIEDSYTRAKKLELVLNNLFEASDILIKESFTVRCDKDNKVVEQIDGVVEIDGRIYLVEVKWWKDPIGVPEISHHLVRVYHRAQCGGIFISTSGYSDPAIETCKVALQKRNVILCKLEEIVLALERNVELKRLIKKKIQTATTHKLPLFEPFATGEL